MAATAFLGYLISLKRNINNNSSNLPFKYTKKYDNLHLKETQLKILTENKFKSGIYLIYNKINGKFYIGCAITNRINTKFINHCIHGTGSSILFNSINKYGLKNFNFIILEYYPGFIHKEDFKKSHSHILCVETKYINLLKPHYNILTVDIHNKETIYKIKSNYSEKRIGLNKKLSTEIKNLEKTKFSKPIILFNKDGTIHSEYNSITKLSKIFKCCTKTINKALKNNTIYKNIGYLKYKDKTE